MKKHYCPAEGTDVEYEGECNWCGEKVMTQDEIIRMATEVWGYADWKGAPLERLEYFAALVAAQEREKQAVQEPVGCVADLDVLQRGFMLDRGYSLHDALYAAPVEPVKREPVSYVYVFDGGHTEFEELSVALPAGTKLYAAPVRTKDLTDDEINEVLWRGGPFESVIDSIRAVIAADREKNNV